MPTPKKKTGTARATKTKAGSASTSKKKTDPSPTTKKKAGTASTTKKKTGSSEFSKAYMRLRTVLDGLQFGAMRYCLDTRKRSTMMARAAEVEALLMPIIDDLRRKSVKPGGGGPGPGYPCGDGYYDCDGVCLPYQCYNAVNQ